MSRIELVGKIGSMALIRKEDNDIDYNRLARLGDELRPGMAWVTSGATEIGRVDVLRRTGRLLDEQDEDAKTDYAAQGQAILMASYRQFIRPEYGVRQVLVEHQHFNDPEKREHVRRMLLRAAEQDAVPIINYNDPVSSEENRRMELAGLRKGVGHPVVECVDNDETAAVVALLLEAKTLVILTSADGLYQDPADPATIVPEILAPTPDALRAKVAELVKLCRGASRAGANGMAAKLQYIVGPAAAGTTVLIANAKHRLSEILAGRVPCTRVGLTTGD